MRHKFSEIITNNDCLFRYRNFDDNAIKALKNNRLYFSKPKYFNDPYDNLIYVNSEKVISEIIGNILSGMDAYLESKKGNADHAYKIASFMWNNKRSREKMIDERIKQIYAAIDTVRGSIKNNTKVICFAEKYDSMLMWSHYAGFHKGFCLVYSKSDIEGAKRYDMNDQEVQNKTKLLRVNYLESQTDMTNSVLEYVRNNMSETMGDVPLVDSSIPSNAIRKIITEKSLDWQYEKEWRLIPRVPRIEEESPLAYIECKPLAVIIGSQCFGEDREQLIYICKEINVSAYGIFLKENDPFCRLSVNDGGDLELERHDYFYYYQK